MNEMGSILKKLRQSKKLSMREAARLIDVPETTYREWEYGRLIRGHEAYLKIAKGFNISLDELFGLQSTSSSVEKDFEQLEILLKSVKKKVLAP